MSPYYVIHAATKIAKVTPVLVQRNMDSALFFSPFSLCKNPKQVEEMRRRHRRVNILIMSLIKPTICHLIQ